MRALHQDAGHDEAQRIEPTTEKAFTWEAFKVEFSKKYKEEEAEVFTWSGGYEAQSAGGYEAAPKEPSGPQRALY